ncbi:MAG: hypothetical protein AVO35_05665 [Candidatus Aegiribacteria sp. MLS_C]|nr:MAG: hypothetical protein AVO35_05665 [Candidatus Aegiribacteria sp. MLS_C]
MVQSHQADLPGIHTWLFWSRIDWVRAVLSGVDVTPGEENGSLLGTRMAVPGVQWNKRELSGVYL